MWMIQHEWQSKHAKLMMGSYLCVLRIASRKLSKSLSSLMFADESDVRVE